MSVTAACRHLDRVLSELAAEYGNLEVVREPREVSAEEYDRLHNRVRHFDSCGGAGAWLRDSSGRVLLVESDEGWREPGATRQPGDDPLDCARQAVRDQTGLDPRLTNVRHVHVRYCQDWTERDSIPLPFVVFTGDAAGEPHEGARWHESVPEDRLYDLLGELSD
ncbi:NUDIX domain-containing protein [Halorarius litoreus]|uniref:NUDIX domain-containing protein n=1 Tax=Halorarius litoreus TaxID=2962676 RepID=UPI0020CF7745|nr:NUDIX hydrolase [Halorarius litoreus]